MCVISTRVTHLWANCRFCFFPDSHNHAADSYSPAGQISPFPLSMSRNHSAGKQAFCAINFSRWSFSSPSYFIVLIVFVHVNRAIFFHGHGTNATLMPFITNFISVIGTIKYKWMHRWIIHSVLLLSFWVQPVFIVHYHGSFVQNKMLSGYTFFKISLWSNLHKQYPS